MAVKAMHTSSTHNILLENLLIDERFEITTNTQAIDVVTFDFKGTHFCCEISGSTDYQMNFV